MEHSFSLTLPAFHLSLFLSHLLQTLRSKQRSHFTSKSKTSPVSTKIIKTTPNNELKPYIAFAMPYQLLLLQQELITSLFSSSLLHIEIKFLLVLLVKSPAISILIWTILLFSVLIIVTTWCD